MKKLLSGFCCILYLHSFSQAPLDAGPTSPKTAGQKVLVRAIAVIVNPEGNKKAPDKTIQVSPKECP